MDTSGIEILYMIKVCVVYCTMRLKWTFQRTTHVSKFLQTNIYIDFFFCNFVQECYLFVCIIKVFKVVKILEETYEFPRSVTLIESTNSLMEGFKRRF